MIDGDFRYCCREWTAKSKRTTRQMHSPQPDVPARTHAHVLMTADSKCTFGRPDGRANLGEIENPIVVRR
jgi:hypothetical protein